MSFDVMDKNEKQVEKKKLKLSKKVRNKLIAGSLAIMTTLTPMMTKPQKVQAATMPLEVQDHINKYGTGNKNSVISNHTKSPNWYAPKGGIWKFSTYNGKQRPIYDVDTITYLTYDQLAVLQATKLTNAQIDSIMAAGRDKFLEKLGVFITKNCGKKQVAKVIPYLGETVIAYDVFGAFAALHESNELNKYIKKHSGVAVIEGTVNGSKVGGSVFPYKTYEAWNGPAIYNPDGCLGTFTKTK